MRTARQRMAVDLKIAGYSKSTAHRGIEKQRDFVLRISHQKARFLRLREEFRDRLEGLCKAIDFKNFDHQTTGLRTSFDSMRL